VSHGARSAALGRRARESGALPRLHLKKRRSRADSPYAPDLRVFSRGRATVPHILIVEDSPTMRLLLTSSLEELDGPVKITQVENGFEALRYLPREHYDLIVTDINMPDINGLELVSFVKSNATYRDIPLIIVSTESTERDRDRGLELGADAYLVKPFEPDELRDLVREMLSRGARSS
jgi:two-component system, chemotaxis family, chemotaxis protein CheY